MDWTTLTRRAFLSSFLRPPSFFFLFFNSLLWIVPLPAPIGTTCDTSTLSTSSVYNLMASCNPTPTLTVFQFVTSATTTTTTFTLALQTQPDGSSTVTLPLIITSVITLVNQTSTLYASCSSLSNLIVTTAISTISQSTMTPPQPSSTPATDTRTTVHTPEISGIVSSINSTPTVIPTFASQSQTSDIAPILGGTLGGSSP
ncbi:hypothetical protein BGY98DRAFT_240184 [Russula aff. rugulosa BPL654]|nr:hypothetical protein BGY98DRAFT_240184 [Russula aff. rugulosa BPL654]